MTDKHSISRPRILVTGIEVSEDFELPPLETVREQAASSEHFRKSGIPPGIVKFDNQNTLNELSPTIREAISCNSLFPELFTYVFHIRCIDLPKDLFEVAIWVLQSLERLWEECSHKQLQDMGYLDCPEEEFQSSRLVMLSNIWWKVAFYLLHQSVDQPSKAVPYLRKFIENVLNLFPSPWMIHPELYALYGEALVRDGSDDEQARTILELFFLAPSSRSEVEFLIRARVHLARVLRRLGEDQKAEEHEAVAIKWFKTCDHGSDQASLRRLLMPDGEKVEPVLQALGGPDWLVHHKQTSRMFHNLSRSCGWCDARQMQKPLRRCSKCQDAYYCSTECQQADWSGHKIKCRIMANTLKQIETLKKTDPKTAERLARWKVWRTEAYHNEAIMHAVGVHRDPNRGRTHILLQFVEYTPGASKDLQYKFKVTFCAVFGIPEILANLDAIFGKEKTDVREAAEGTLKRFSDKNTMIKPTKVPLISLKLGNGLEPWLTLSFVPTETLRRIPYNPDWRALFNNGEKPGLLKLKSLRLENKEHVF